MGYLRVSNMTKKYNDNIILDNINVNFKSHGLYLVSGESGSGKSTFLKCISGITSFDEGEILFDENKIKSFEEFRRNNISFIFQDFELINYLTVRENIALPLLIKGMKRKEAYIKARKMLRLVDIEDKENELVKHLSGGQKQRVAILRALISENKIILCDEITGSLDEESAIGVMDIIKDISKDHLVIMVSHDLSMMNLYADYILKIENKIIREINDDGEDKYTISKSKNLKKDNTFHLAINNLKKGKFRLCLSLLSFSITFTFLLIIIGFSSTATSYLDSHKNDFVDYSILKVTEKKITKLENSSLSLIQEILPTSEELYSLCGRDNIKLHTDLDPFIPMYPSLEINSEVINNIQLLPCSRKEQIKYGILLNSVEEVIVNDEARRIIGENNQQLKLRINKNVDYVDEEIIISDTLSLNLSFSEKGIVNEFSFFNTPKIYYSLEFMEEFLSSIEVENLSEYYSKSINWLQRLSLYSFKNDEFVSYYKIIEILDDKYVEEIYQRFPPDKYEVISSSLVIITQFNNIYQIMMNAMEIFIVICLIISFMLFSLIIFSFVVSSKNEIGLYKVFSLSNKSIIKMFEYKSLLIICISFTISEFMKIIVLNIGNRFVYRKINIELEMIYFSKIEIGIFLLLLVFSALVSYIPSLMASKIEIDQIIKEE